jgi:hypothetical protein
MAFPLRVCGVQMLFVKVLVVFGKTRSHPVNSPPKSPTNVWNETMHKVMSWRARSLEVAALHRCLLSGSVMRRLYPAILNLISLRPFPDRVQA